MINRRILWVAFATACLAVAALSLAYANHWWLSALVTLSIGCWLTGVLWVCFAVRERRGFALGALAASFLYLLLACGPWFESHVAPWLLTTRALVVLDAQVFGHDHSQDISQVATSNTYWVDTTRMGLGYPVQPSAAIWTMPQATAALSATPPVVPIGHWLFAWCAAAIGGFVAGRMASRQRRPEAPP